MTYGITNDGEFTKRVNKKLNQHLHFTSNHADTIVCAIHHVPSRELLKTTHTSVHTFLNAFSGSKETGNIIKAFPKAKYVFCGHTPTKESHYRRDNGNKYRERLSTEAF